MLSTTNVVNQTRGEREKSVLCTWGKMTGVNHHNQDPFFFPGTMKTTGRDYQGPL
jgi:hypothetical protein